MKSLKKVTNKTFYYINKIKKKRFNDWNNNNYNNYNNNYTFNELIIRDITIQ